MTLEYHPLFATDFEALVTLQTRIPYWGSIY